MTPSALIPVTNIYVWRRDAVTFMIHLHWWNKKQPSVCMCWWYTQVVLHVNPSSYVLLGFSSMVLCWKNALCFFLKPGNVRLPIMMYSNHVAALALERWVYYYERVDQNNPTSMCVRAGWTWRSWGDILDSCVGTGAGPSPNITTQPIICCETNALVWELFINIF